MIANVMAPNLTSPAGGVLAPRSASSSATSTSANSGLNAMASEQTFLQLLVSQLQNQDPLNPQDGTQFVSQLAQFSSLEEQIQSNTYLSSINNDLTSAVTPSGTTSGNSTPSTQAASNL